MRRKKFQKAGRAEETYYMVPEEFQSATGMNGLTEQGIGIYPGKRYDQCYVCRENEETVSNYEKVRGCAMLLRSAGVSYCFYDLPNMGKTLLLLSLHAGSLKEAIQAFSLLEQDMQGNLYTFGITIQPLSAEEKLSLMHHLIMLNAGSARIDVARYLDKTSGWLPEYKLQHEVEQKNFLKAADGCSSVLFIRRVPAEHAAAVYRCIKQQECLKLLVSVYEPVSDQKVLDRLRECYIGYEATLYALARKKTGIGKIEEGREERRYVYAGIYFILSASEEKMLEEKKACLRKRLQEYGCDVADFWHHQKETWRRLAVLSPWEIRQSMLLPSGCMIAMHPFCREEGNLMEEDMGTKAELLAVFDTMMEGGKQTECRL